MNKKLVLGITIILLMFLQIALPIVRASPTSISIFSTCVNNFTVEINGIALNAQSVTWNWDDGSTSTGLFPVGHTYTVSSVFHIVASEIGLDGITVTSTTSANVGPGVLTGCISASISAGAGGSVAYQSTTPLTSIGASGVVSAGQSIQDYLAAGTGIDLTANPISGFDFSGWTLGSGVNIAPISPCQATSCRIISVSVQNNAAISAMFAPKSPSPLFQLTVSPQTQILPVDGSASYEVRIVPFNNFRSTMIIDLSNIPQGVGAQLLKNSGTCVRFPCIALPSDYSMTLTLDAFDLQPTGSLQLVLSATSIAIPPTTLSASLTLVITKLIGIRNILSPITEFHVSTSTYPCDQAFVAPVNVNQCFSIQQNFFVKTPGGVQRYWAQNALLVGKFFTSTGTSMINALPVVNIFDFSASSHPLIWCNGKVVVHPDGKRGCQYNTAPHATSDPLVLTSSIVGTTLQLESFGQIATSFSLPAGSYIASLQTAADAPQIDIVGVSNFATATFDSFGYGNILSNVLLSSQPDWTNAQQQTVLHCPPSCTFASSGTSTGETSLNLQMIVQYSSPLHSSIGYVQGVKDEGIAFLPGTLRIETVTGAIIQSGGISTTPAGNVGVSFAITGSSAPDGTPITITASQLAALPPNVPLPPLDVTYYKLGIQGISDGVATICVANLGVDPQTVLMYWTGLLWQSAGNVNSSAGKVCGTISVLFLTGTLIAVGDPSQVSVSNFFTDTNLRPIPIDAFGNPEVRVLLLNGRVIGTSPSLILAWVNITNIGSLPLQSLKLNETLPLDWVVSGISPPWKVTIGDTTISVSSGNPETFHLTVSNFNGTLLGHPLMPGKSLRVPIPLFYKLLGTNQSGGSYPRTYTYAAVAAVWTRASFTGAESRVSSSAILNAYAKNISSFDSD